MFQQIAPILPSLNLLETAAFYKDKLGFEISYMNNLLVAMHSGERLFFDETKDKKNFASASCLLFVKNIEDVYARFSVNGIVLPKGKLKDQPGRVKSFSIQDNNGHVLQFAEVERF